MSKTKENLWNKLTQKETFESFDFTDLYKSKNKFADLLKDYNKIWLYSNKKEENKLKEFLLNWLSEKKVTKENITHADIYDWTFYLYLDSWESISFVKEDINKSILKKIWLPNKKEIEKKAKSITKAIKSIFEENKWTFWNDEINDEDIVNDKLIKKYKLDKSLKWQTLLDLKRILDLENLRLRRVYQITWETKKTVEILKTEIEIYTWVWDKFEWWARYFSLKTKEIWEKVLPLVNSMKYEDLFSYMKDLHKKMDDDIFHGNYKKSDMVLQQNRILFERIYSLTFDRLKRENPSNKVFLDFIKVMTWRWDLISDKWEEFDYEDLDWSSEFRDMKLANTAMIYVMQKKWWIIENIIKEDNLINKVEFKDDDLRWRSVKWVLSEANTVFWKLWKSQWKTANDLITDMKLESIIWLDKDYNNLTFDEKVKLWALARMLNLIEDTNIEDIKQNPNILMDKLSESLSDSFNDINESLWKNFDWKFWITWKTSSELWLEWDLAEVYELYQDVNWNNLMDLSDDNWFNNFTWAWSATMAFGIISAWVAIWLLIWSAPVSGPIIMLAWASAWAVSWLMSSLFSTQGYDSLSEWSLDVIWTMAIDAIVWAIFLLSSIRFFTKVFNINILAEKLFSKINATDMVAFGWMETIANVILYNKYISPELKKKFLENHFDTDKSNYHNEIKKNNI